MKSRMTTLPRRSDRRIIPESSAMTSSIPVLFIVATSKSGTSSMSSDTPYADAERPNSAKDEYPMMQNKTAPTPNARQVSFWRRTSKSKPATMECRIRVDF